MSQFHLKDYSFKILQGKIHDYIFHFAVCFFLFFIFRETNYSIYLSQGQYYVYLSAQYAHLGWHVGLTKSGKAKKGQKTAYPANQKAIQFLRKPIVTPTFDLDLTKNNEDLTFIDEDHDQELHKGPMQVIKIK